MQLSYYELRIVRNSLRQNVRQLKRLIDNTTDTEAIAEFSEQLQEYTNLLIKIETKLEK